MATKVHMEALSPTMEEGQVVSWLKSEGDAVTNGDVIAEIETDKATMELVARGDGILRKIFVGEGGTAPVGDVIAIIADEGEDIEGMVPAGAGAAGAAASGDGASADDANSQSDQDLDETVAAEAPAVSPTAEPPASAPPAASADGGRVKASPLARRLAEEAGLSLGSVAGTGPGGRVVKRDVESAVAAGGAVGASAAAAPGAPVTAGAADVAAGPAGGGGLAGLSGLAPRASDGPEFEEIPLSQMRKTIANRLVQSIGPIPHFFLTIDLDMTRAVAARARINEMLAKDGAKISLNDMLMKATAAALRLHPACNAHWMGDSVRRFNRVHLGVAVAVEDGLITPVVRDADGKGVLAIGQEVRELAGRAREKRLKPEEYTGATFSISNLGMFGIHEFTAVINPPEAAILAIGALEEKPMVVDGALATQQRMKVTMSCDHRVIDGATGAQFLQTLRTFIEEPAAALLV